MNKNGRNGRAENRCGSSAVRRLATRLVAVMAGLALGSGVCWGARDLTFVVASDLHYYGTNANTRIQAHIDRINTLPGTAYPDSVGGAVGPVSGVILNGDLTDRGTVGQWAFFADDWGLTGERRCKFPVYEGLGNHDYYSGDILVSNIVQRNESRPGVLNICSNGLHYSWEWSGIHFIQAHLVVEDDSQPRARGALAFIRDDLAKHVGDTGKPVIVNFHLSPVIDRDWAFERQKPLLETLARYNVLGVFCGHSHGYIVKDGQRVPDPDYECRKFPGSSLDLYDDGSLRDCGARPRWKDSGRFFVVRVTDTHMTVIMNTPQGWGVPHVKAIAIHGTMPAQPVPSK